MKEITSISGACTDQARIKIRFDLKGKFKKLIETLIGEGFSLSIDQEGFLYGEARGTFEEISRLLELLKIKGFKSENEGNFKEINRGNLGASKFRSSKDDESFL